MSQVKLALNVHFEIKNDLIDAIHLKLASKPGLQWTINAAHPMIEKKIDQWMNDYSQKRSSSIVLPLNWNLVSPFTQSVLAILHALPFGTHLSYQQVAEKLATAPRAVGGACGRNPFLLVVPCHRILAADGSLGGFSAGLEIKEHLLSFEK